MFDLDTETHTHGPSTVCEAQSAQNQGDPEFQPRTAEQNWSLKQTPCRRSREQHHSP